MKSRILTRDEIYQLVWSRPATELAKDLGVSDVAITKLCRRHSIPKPWPGYWRIVEAGGKPKIPSLPRLGPMKPSQIEIWPSEPQAKRIEEPLPPDVLESIAREKLVENRILVPNTLEKAHSVIKRAEKLFKKAVPDGYNRLGFPSFRMESPKISVSVSREALDRSLRILAALIEAIESRGHKIKVDKNSCQAFVNGECITFAIHEKVNRSKRTEKERTESNDYQRWMYTPTGQLTFSISSWASGTKSNWKDTKALPLEDQLNDVMVGLLKHAALAPGARLAWEENQRSQEQLRHEAEQRRIEEEIRRYEYRLRCEALEKQFTNWKESSQLRIFLNECERALSNEDHKESGSTRWLSWAHQYVDSIDPFKNGGLQTMISKLNVENQKPLH